MCLKHIKFHAGICILLDLSIFLHILMCIWLFRLNFVFYIQSGDALCQTRYCFTACSVYTNAAAFMAANRKCKNMISYLYVKTISF